MMTEQEKKDFVNELINKHKQRIVNRVQHMPAYWGKEEISTYVLFAFTRIRRIPSDSPKYNKFISEVTKPELVFKQQ
jgi:hypothetical protein